MVKVSLKKSVCKHFTPNRLLISSTLHFSPCRKEEGGGFTSIFIFKMYFYYVLPNVTCKINTMLENLLNKSFNAIVFCQINAMVLGRHTV